MMLWKRKIYNAKIKNVDDKTASFSTVKNKTPNDSDLVKKAEYKTKTN